MSMHTKVEGIDSRYCIGPGQRQMNRLTEAVIDFSLCWYVT